MNKIIAVLLIVAFFSTVVSAKVDIGVDQYFGTVIVGVKNAGNESAYILNSLTIVDEKGNEVTTSKGLCSAEVLRIDPGISYAFEWHRDFRVFGEYTVKIFHGDNRKNLEPVLFKFYTEPMHDFGLFPLLSSDKRIYKYGDNVSVAITNNIGKFFVNVNNWEIKNLDTGKMVFMLSQDCEFGYRGCADSFEPFKYGLWKAVENFWGQTDINGNQVVPGKYGVTAEYSENDPSSENNGTEISSPFTPPHVPIRTISSRIFYIIPPQPVRGDLNGNCVSADADDEDMMKKASIGEITPDSMFDLNDNGIHADVGDLVLMKRASKGEIDLQNTTPLNGEAKWNS